MHKNRNPSRHSSGESPAAHICHAELGHQWYAARLHHSFLSKHRGDSVQDVLDISLSPYTMRDPKCLLQTKCIIAATWMEPLKSVEEPHSVAPR